jgi:antitoxin component YwqK of YwqJK toxin-antitoxin module
MKLILIITYLFAGCTASAQEQVRIYLKNNDTKVYNADSADYIRVIHDHGPNSNLYQLTEYYKNDKLKRTGYIISPTSVHFEGECRNFYPSGILKSQLNYKSGLLQGDQLYYFSNGKLREVRTYTERSNSKKTGFNYLLKAWYDSTGTKRVTDGNGYISSYQCYPDHPNAFNTEEGEIKNNLKTGTWKGYSIRDTISYTESYKNNKMISAIATHADGTSNNYKYRITTPEYPGGSIRFFSSVANNVRQATGIDLTLTDGEVFQVFIKADGSASDVRFLQAGQKLIEKEIKKTILTGSKWIPGTRFGRAADMYTVTYVTTWLKLSTKDADHTAQ